MTDKIKLTFEDLTEGGKEFTRKIDKWYDNLRSMMADEMSDFVISNKLTEKDAINIRDNDLIPQPHLGVLSALLEDEDFEFYNEGE